MGRPAALVEGRPRPHLTVDLSGVVALNSIALAKLITLNGRVRAAGGRLALVDPSPVVRRARAVTTGGDALAACAADPPDVVVPDLVMPGVSGWEVARRLRDAGGGPVVVALSGCGGREDRRRAAEAGVGHYLVKPAEPAALVRLLRELAASVTTPAAS